MPRAEYRRGQPSVTDPQMPYGAAKKLNDQQTGMPKAPPRRSQAPAAQEPMTEDQELLFGDLEEAPSTDDPRQFAQDVSQRVSTGQLPVPTRVLRMLPALKKAANQPGASPLLQAYYRALVLSIEQKVKANGR